MNEEYKCEYSKYEKIYSFEFKPITYTIKIINKEIVLIIKKNNIAKELRTIKKEKQIYNEIQLIKNYLEKKLSNFTL